MECPINRYAFTGEWRERAPDNVLALMKFYPSQLNLFFTMAPIYVKGGVWTNVEDEILKAAVQKYGLTQWSRVASLLTKKSAKQAKARWNEWLNPKIKKDSWSREEDEKLLNLVKLLPNQWRSIAPIMGRTATHCVERYQKLLDDNDLDRDEGSDEEEVKISGPGIESLPATGNTHVGDLNINPESKPARPDDEELEDADREMLFEARARLANTKGKKAKRREREKMLEETKRISLLQKRRELKAAGVSSSLVLKNKQKSKEFDYNADIPFEHTPPAGLYDTTEEDINSELVKTRFEKDVYHKGLASEKPKGKRDRKKLVKQIEGAAEVDEPPAKRSKLELPNVEGDARPEYGTTELSGVFETPKAKPLDIDERISQATEEIKHAQAQQSSLLASDSVSGGRKESLSAKQRVKMIRKLVAEEFSQLPVPRIEYLPSLGHPTLLIETSDPKDLVKDLKDLKESEENTTKVNLGQGKSLVVQRNLEIPHPNQLTNPNLSGIDKEIAEEFQALIKSDYRKYVDPTFDSVKGLSVDPQILRQVQAEISQKVGDSTSLHRAIKEYQLPHDPQTISDVITTTAQLKQQAQRLQQGLYEQGKYEDTTPVMARINELNELYDRVAIEYKVFSDIAKNEEVIMEARALRLQRSVDSVVEKERQLTTELRQ